MVNFFFFFIQLVDGMEWLSALNLNTKFWERIFNKTLPTVEILRVFKNAQQCNEI